MSEIVEGTQSNYLRILASKHGYAPYIFVFLNPKSKSWNSLHTVCEKYSRVVIEENKCYICYFEPKITNDYIIINNIVQTVKQWSTAFLFIDGIFQSLKNIKWLECFNQSTHAKDIDSYCVRVDRAILQNEWYRMLLPCKFLRTTSMWIDDNHPSSLQDQLQARAIGICHLCPNFKIDKFKILEKFEEDISPAHKAFFNDEPDEEEELEKPSSFINKLKGFFNRKT